MKNLLIFPFFLIIKMLSDPVNINDHETNSKCNGIYQNIQFFKSEIYLKNKIKINDYLDVNFLFLYQAL